MKIVTRCPSCREEVEIKANASTRPDLAQIKGETFGVNCSHCGKNFTTHVNDVSATVNQKFILMGWILGAVTTVVSIFFIGFIAVATFALPFIIMQTQRNQAHAFNGYRL